MPTFQLRNGSETAAASAQMPSSARSPSHQSNHLETEMESFLHMIRTGSRNRCRAERGLEPLHGGMVSQKLESVAELFLASQGRQRGFELLFAGEDARISQPAQMLLLETELSEAPLPGGER